ncbi:hypothetical protein CI41S_20430 [Bradyrhizobium ivorense]|nr:hypothetical protein CI41S_20430 [Bradyrhizobium ivorense]
MKSPEGTVITLNGPWGAGKSSAVNLVLHHLKDALDKDELAVVNFACWWFRGEQALAILGDKFKKALPKIDARMLKAGSLVSAGADLAGATASVGTLASGAMS